MTISFEEPLRQCQADEPQDLLLSRSIQTHFLGPGFLSLLPVTCFFFFKEASSLSNLSCFLVSNVTKSAQLSAK